MSSKALLPLAILPKAPDESGRNLPKRLAREGAWPKSTTPRWLLLREETSSSCRSLRVAGAMPRVSTRGENWLGPLSKPTKS